MNKSLFNSSMSSYEARTTLFTAVEGKTKEEVKQIKAEYSAVAKEITRRELAENNGWMTSDKLE